MKKTVFTSFVLFVFGFISCMQKGPETVNGIVFDASMNNITLITDKGDTMNISTMDADPAKVPGVLINDSVKVIYVKEHVGGVDVLKATGLAVTAHSPYFYIQGAWAEPNPIDAKDIQGFKLNQDGTASSINMATLEINSWNLEGKDLILGYKSIGNGLTFEGQDTLNIVKLNADSLILSENNQITWRLARQK